MSEASALIAELCQRLNCFWEVAEQCDETAAEGFLRDAYRIALALQSTSEVHGRGGQAWAVHAALSALVEPCPPGKMREHHMCDCVLTAHEYTVIAAVQMDCAPDDVFELAKFPTNPERVAPLMDIFWEELGIRRGLAPAEGDR